MAAGCLGAAPQYYTWYEMYRSPFPSLSGHHWERDPGVSLAGRRQFRAPAARHDQRRAVEPELNCAARVHAVLGRVDQRGPVIRGGRRLPLADYRAAASASRSPRPGDSVAACVAVLAHLPGRRDGPLQPRGGRPADLAVPGPRIQRLLVPGELSGAGMAGPLFWSVCWPAR